MENINEKYTYEEIVNERIREIEELYKETDSFKNLVTYNESKPFIDNNLTEYIIKGGNHAQFASYGVDPKNGKASISPEQQRKETEEQILKFINN